MTEITITKTADGDTLTIAVEGWLDTLTSPQFHDAVQELDGAKNVVLDFGGVGYISSAGLRETVALFRRVTANGGEFSVRRVMPAVMDVFTTTGFDKNLILEARS